MPGNLGGRTTKVFGQLSATVYTEQVQYGAGGMPVGLLSPMPIPGSSYYYENGVSDYTKAARLPVNGNPFYGTGGEADSDNISYPGDKD